MLRPLERDYIGGPWERAVAAVRRSDAMAMAQARRQSGPTSWGGVVARDREQQPVVRVNDARRYPEFWTGEVPYGTPGQLNIGGVGGPRGGYVNAGRGGAEVTRAARETSGRRTGAQMQRQAIDNRAEGVAQRAYDAASRTLYAQGNVDAQIQNAADDVGLAGPMHGGMQMGFTGARSPEGHPGAPGAAPRDGRVHSLESDGGLAPAMRQLGPDAPVSQQVVEGLERYLAANSHRSDAVAPGASPSPQPVVDDKGHIIGLSMPLGAASDAVFARRTLIPTALYRLPDVPQEPFAAAYPNGAPTDASGRLLEDRWGNPIDPQALIAGRRQDQGAMVPLSAAEHNEIAVRITGLPITRLPREDYPLYGDDGAMGVEFDTKTGDVGPGRQVFIADDLAANMPHGEGPYVSHEVAHALDLLVTEVQNRDQYRAGDWGMQAERATRKKRR